MLSGCSVAARDLRSFQAAKFSKDLRLEGHADICPAQHENQLRRNQAIRSRAGEIAGRPTSRACSFRDEEGDSYQQNLCGLESERRAQDDRQRVFASRARTANRFNSDHLGGSRTHSEEEEYWFAGVRIASDPRSR